MYSGASGDAAADAGVLRVLEGMWQVGSLVCSSSVALSWTVAVARCFVACETQYHRKERGSSVLYEQVLEDSEIACI